MKEAELRNGVIGGVGRLKTLPTADTYADVRCLYHAHIIGSITDGQGDCVDILFDQFNQFRFLSWGHPVEK